MVLAGRVVLDGVDAAQLRTAPWQTRLDILHALHPSHVDDELLASTRPEVPLAHAQRTLDRYVHRWLGLGRLAVETGLGRAVLALMASGLPRRLATTSGVGVVAIDRP